MKNISSEPKDIVVSICCLAYNHEKYIKKAIEGFLIQKTSFPFEILIHDDASTDNTPKIIKEFEIKYPNIIKPIYQKENQFSKGVSVSATYQFPRAKGKYIALCEGDDYWTDPYKLQKQVDFLEANQDYSLCFHNAVILWEEKTHPPKYFCDRNQKSILTIEDILYKWSIPTASMLFRTKYIKSYLQEFQGIYNGDWFVQLILASNGKIKYINEVMSVYRKTNTNLSATLGKNYNFIYKQKRKTLKRFDSITNFTYHKMIKRKLLTMKIQTIVMNIKYFNKYTNFIYNCISIFLKKLLYIKK